MRYNLLGNSGLFVSEMCLGTMVFGPSTGRYAGAGDVQQDEVDRIVRRAFDAGINFVDTANVYSGGHSEEMIGRSLKNLGIARHQVVIATKVEHATGSGPNDGGASRYHLIDQLKTSLKRLGTDHIDLYQLHGWDPATPLEETIRALDDLVRQGHVRYVGVSNWAAWQISKALGVAERVSAVPFQSVQAYYSLAARELEREIVPMLQAERLGLLVYSPLAGGYLSGKYRDGSKGRRSIIPFPQWTKRRAPRARGDGRHRREARDVAVGGRTRVAPPPASGHQPDPRCQASRPARGKPEGHEASAVGRRPRGPERGERADRRVPRVDVPDRRRRAYDVAEDRPAPR